MKTISKQKVKKLADWAGFVYKDVHNPNCHCGAIVMCLVAPDGTELPEWMVGGGMPDLTTDLSACFRWLVPKAIDKIMAEQGCSRDVAYAILFKKWLQELELIIPEAALALCLAILKLIDEEREI